MQFYLCGSSFFGIILAGIYVVRLKICKIKEHKKYDENDKRCLQEKDC